MRVLDGAAAIGTCGRHRYVVGLIDNRWHTSAPLSPIRRARFAARPTRIGYGGTLRERGGLAEAGAPCGLECVAQALVFASQSLQLGAQSSELFGLFFDQVGEVRLRHATVMPELATQYKLNRARTR